MMFTSQPEILITQNSTKQMPKSLAEKERLAINAKNQDILLRQQNYAVVVPKKASQKGNGDVYQPEGEIDYSKFNKSKKK